MLNTPNIKDVNSNDSSSVTKVQNIKELFDFHKQLLGESKSKKQPDIKKDLNNSEKIKKISVGDGEKTRVKINLILDNIAGGGIALKDELKFVGDEAAKKAEYINAERQIFARQLKNCKTREDAERLYHGKVMSMNYGITKMSGIPKNGREMIGRYVRTMRSEWSKYVAGMK